MRIGTMIDTEGSVDDIVARVQSAADAGFASAWSSQIFGPDALTALAVAGARVPGIELGTGVVPVHPRHPQMLAQQALTVQSATGNRLCLGIGLSHAMVVEGMWGLSYARGARYMTEYLSILVPLLAGEVVQFEGEFLTLRAFAPIAVGGAEAPPVLVAALGPQMLRQAGRLASGTVTWMTGTATIADHIVPSITAATDEAGRPAPRVAVALPVAVTDDPERARRQIDEAFALYPHLPSYKAMLDREGAANPADIAFVGSAEQVRDHLGRLAEAGATDFVATLVSGGDERERTVEVLMAAAGS